MNNFYINFKAAVKPASEIFFAGISNVPATFKNAAKGHLRANTGVF